MATGANTERIERQQARSDWEEEGTEGGPIRRAGAGGG